MRISRKKARKAQRTDFRWKPLGLIQPIRHLRAICVHSWLSYSAFGFWASLASGQLNAIIGRRLAEDSLEDPVEVGKRLEAYFKGDLADAQVRVEQQVLGALDAQTGQIIGEVDTGDFAEHFAEIKAARVYSFGDLGQ